MSRVFTEREVVELLLATSESEFVNDGEAREWIASHVEHMEAGGYEVGQEVAAWVYVWITDDGPSVTGPFGTEDEAMAALLRELVDLRDLETIAAARRYYDSSGDQWVVRLGVG